MCGQRVIEACAIAQLEDAGRKLRLRAAVSTVDDLPQDSSPAVTRLPGPPRVRVASMRCVYKRPASRTLAACLGTLCTQTRAVPTPAARKMIWGTWQNSSASQANSRACLHCTNLAARMRRSHTLKFARGCRSCSRVARAESSYTHFTHNAHDLSVALPALVTRSLTTHAQALLVSSAAPRAVLAFFGAGPALRSLLSARRCSHSAHSQ